MNSVQNIESDRSLRENIVTKRKIEWKNSEGRSPKDIVVESTKEYVKTLPDY